MESETCLRVVPLDGTLVSIIPTFGTLASSLLNKPVAVTEPLEPPHTFDRMCAAAHLSPEEKVRVRACIAGIADFWQTLPPVDTPFRNVLPEYPVVFHARRFKTRGNRVLYQTVVWLENHGFKNPIVWLEEDV